MSVLCFKFCHHFSITYLVRMTCVLQVMWSEMAASLSGSSITFNCRSFPEVMGVQHCRCVQACECGWERCFCLEPHEVRAHEMRRCLDILKRKQPNRCDDVHLHHSNGVSTGGNSGQHVLLRWLLISRLSSQCNFMKDQTYHILLYNFEISK